jgi:hypothetical protein
MRSSLTSSVPSRTASTTEMPFAPEDEVAEFVSEGPVPGGQPLLDEKDVVVAVLPPLAAKHPPVEAPDLGMRNYLTYTNACRNVVKANGKMHTTCRSTERTDFRIGFA